MPLRKTLLLFFIIFLFSFRTQAQTEGIGVGLVFGEPVGVDIKRWVDENNAFELAIAYSVATTHNRLTLHADYLWHKFNFAHSRERFALHYGIGLRYSTRTDESNVHGIRFIGGILWYPHPKVPFDLYMEVAPVMVYHPTFGLNFDAGAGIRYYFKTIY